ncbi:MAG: toll/interleukin-1 receptor domain-containing protein [Candidatus Fibromonas sp.]|jgi:hypothetical protein|nr:toll/interleukin-1 receptor domain-containing protein [Candidatus Fibromonas sp.]
MGFNNKKHKMTNKKFEIFISYRRKGGFDTAKLLYDRLRMDGYSVSFDIDTLVNGNFDDELEQRVKDCKDFLLVLNPGIFDRFFESDPEYDAENDWVRREIKCALAENKNIVPIWLEGFAYPKNLPDNVKEIVKEITRKNALDLNHKYFDAAYEKMKSFMISKPCWTVRHRAKIISFLSIVLLAIAAYLYFAITQITSQKEQEIQVEKQRTDSIIKYNDSVRVERQKRRSKEKILHWSANDDIIWQVIFEKIKGAGVEKTECSGNGRIVSPNKFKCRENPDTKKWNCFYSPRITFTTCDNKPITFLEMNEGFKTEPQADSVAAVKELANKLKNADFSEWISEMKNIKQ